MRNRGWHGRNRDGYLVHNVDMARHERYSNRKCPYGDHDPLQRQEWSTLSSRTTPYFNHASDQDPDVMTQTHVSSTSP